MKAFFTSIAIGSMFFVLAAVTVYAETTPEAEREEAPAVAAAAAKTAEKSNVHQEIDSCGGSQTCIAHALARLIEGNGGGGGGGGGIGTTVYMYRSDSCASELIRPVRVGITMETCQRLGQQITARVWGIRYDNQPCMDIPDASFTEACVRYAAE